MDSTDRYGLEAQFRFVHNDALRGMKTVGGRLDVLMRQMDDLGDRSEVTSTTFERSMRQISRGGTAVATKQVEKIATGLDRVQKTLGPIRDEFRAIKAEAKNIDFGDLSDPQAFKQGKKAIDSYITSLSTLEKQVKGNSASERVLAASIKNQQRAARSRMEAIEAERQALAAAQKQGSSALAVGAGAAIVAPMKDFAKDAITVFADFDERMAKVAAATEATGSDLTMLRERAKELGATTKYSSSEAADAMKYLAMAGLKTGEIYTAVADALQLASAGELDLAEAADITTKVMAGMGMKVDELTHITDVLGKTATATNTSVQGLGQAMAYAAPQAKAFNTSLEEAAAMMGTMANAGIDASSAGTAMRSLFTRLAKPPKEAAAALAQLNIQIADAKTGATRNVLDIMTEIGTKIGMNAEDVVRTKKFFKDAAAAGKNIDAAIDAEILKGGRNAEQLAKIKAIFGQEGMSGAMANLSNIEKTKENSLTNLASTFDPKAMKATIAALGKSIPELQKLYELANSTDIRDRQKFENLDLSKFLVKNVAEYGDQVKYVQAAKEALTKDSADKIELAGLARIQAALEARKGEDEDFARKFANVDFTAIEGGAATYEALAKGIGNTDLAIGVFNTTARNNKVVLANTMSTADKMAKVMDDNLGGAFKNLDSAREAFMLNFIEPLAPAIRFATERLTDFLSFLANLPAPIRLLIGIGGALVASMGALLLAGGSLGVLIFGFQQSAATASIAIATLERGIVPLTGFYQTAMLAAAGTGPFNGRLAAMGTLAKQAIAPLDRVTASMSRFGTTTKLALLSPLGIAVMAIAGTMLALDALMPQLNLFGQIFSAIAAPVGFAWGLVKGLTSGLLELINPLVATTSAIAGFPFANIGEGLAMAIAAFNNFASQGEAIGKLAANFLSMPLIMAASWISVAWDLAIGSIRDNLSRFVAFVDLIRVMVINLLNHSPTVQIPLAWEGAIATMQGYLTSFFNSARDLGLGLIRSLNTTASTIQAIFGSIFASGSLWGGIKTAGTILGGIVRGWGGNIAGILGRTVWVAIRIVMWDIVDGIDRFFFRQLLPLLERRVKEGFGKTGVSAATYFAAALGAWLLKTSITISIIAFAHNISNRVLAAFNNIQPQIQAKWEGTIDWIMNCLSRFVIFVEGIGSNLISALAKNSPGPLYWIELKWQQAIEFIQGLLAGFQTKASAIGTQIAGSFTQAGNTIQAVFSSIFAGGSLWEGMKTAGIILGGIVRGWGSNIARALGVGLYAGIATAVGFAIWNIQLAFTSVLLPLLKQVVEKFVGKTAARLGIHFAAVLVALLLKSSLFKAIFVFGKRLADGLYFALIDIQPQIQAKWEGTIDWIMNCLSRFVTFVEGIGSNLISALAKNSPGPLYWIELKWQQAIEFIQGLLVGFQTKASAIGANIASSIGSIATTIGKKFAPAIGSITGLFNGLSSKFNFGERFGLYLDTKFQLASTIAQFEELHDRATLDGSLIDVAGFKTSLAEIGAAITYLLKVLIPVGLTESLAIVTRSITLVGDTLLKGIAGIDRQKIESEANETVVAKLGSSWGKGISQAGYRLVEVRRQAGEVNDLANANRENLARQYQEALAGTTNIAERQAAQYKYYFALADTYIKQFGEYVRMTIASVLSVLISGFDIASETIIGVGRIVFATLTGAAYLSGRYFLLIPDLVIAAWDKIWQLLERMNLADWARARGAELAAAFTPDFTFAPTIDGRGTLDVSATIEDALTNLGSVATHLLDPFINFNDTLSVLHSTMGAISKGIGENIDLFNLLMLVVSTMPLGLVSGGFLGKLPGAMVASGAGGGTGMAATLAIKPLYRALALMSPAIVGTLISSGLGASIPAAIISLVGVGLASNATTKVGKLFASTLALGAMLQINNLAPTLYRAFIEAIGGFLDWEGLVPRAKFDTMVANAEAFIGKYYGIFDRAKTEAIDNAKTGIEGMPQLDGLLSGLYDIQVIIQGIYAALDAVKINIGGFDLSIIDLLGIDIAIKAFQGLRALIATDEFASFTKGVKEAIKAIYDITAGFGNTLFGSLTTLWALTSQTFQQIATIARQILTPVFTFVGDKLLAAGVVVMSYLEKNFPAIHRLLLQIWGVEQQVQKAVVDTVKAVGTTADEVVKEAVVVAEEASSAVVRFLMKLPFGKEILVPLYTGAVWLGQNIGPLLTKGIAAATLKAQQFIEAFGFGRLKVLFASGIEGLTTIVALLGRMGSFAGVLVADLGVAVSFLANFLKHYKSTIGFIEYGIRAITPIDLFVLFNPGTDSELKSVVIQKFKMLAGLSKVMRTGATLEEVMAAMGYLQKIRLFVPAILSYVGAIGLAALAIYPVIKSLARAFLDWLTSPAVVSGIISGLTTIFTKIGLLVLSYGAVFATSLLTGLSLYQSFFVGLGAYYGFLFVKEFISWVPKIGLFILEMLIRLPGDMLHLIGKGFQAIGWIFWGLRHPVQAYENTLWALRHPIESLKILLKALMPEWMFERATKAIDRMTAAFWRLVQPIEGAVGTVTSFVGGVAGQIFGNVFSAIAKILDGTIDLGDAIKNVLATAIAAFTTFAIATKLLGKNAFTVLGTLFKGLFSPIFTIFDKFERLARIIQAPFQLAKRSAHQSRVEQEKYNLALDRANVIVSKQKNAPLLIGKAIRSGVDLYNKKTGADAQLLSMDAVRSKEKGFSRREELIALDEEVRKMAAERLFAEGIRGEIKGRFGRSYTESQIGGMTDKLYASSEDVKIAIERMATTRTAASDNSAAYTKAAIASLAERDVKRDGFIKMGYSAKTIAAEIKKLDASGKLEALNFGSSLAKIAATKNAATGEILTGLNSQDLRSKFIAGENLFNDDTIVRAKNVHLYLDGNSTAIRRLVGESTGTDGEGISQGDIRAAMQAYYTGNGSLPPHNFANQEERDKYNRAIAKRVTQSQNGLYSPRTYDRSSASLGHAGNLPMNLSASDREFIDRELKNFGATNLSSSGLTFADAFAPTVSKSGVNSDVEIDAALRLARGLQSIALKSGSLSSDDSSIAFLSIPTDNFRRDGDFGDNLGAYFKKIASANPLSFYTLFYRYNSSYKEGDFKTDDGLPHAGDINLFNRILADRIGSRFSGYSEDANHSKAMQRVFATSLLQDPRAFAAAVAESRSIDPRSSRFEQVVRQVAAIKNSLEKTLGKDLGLFQQVNVEMMALNQSIKASGNNNLQLLKSIAQLDEASLATLIGKGKVGNAADVSAAERQSIESLFADDKDEFERVRKLTLLSGGQLTDRNGLSLQTEDLLGNFALSRGGIVASIDDFLKHGMFPTNGDISALLNKSDRGDRIDFDALLPTSIGRNQDPLAYYQSLRQARTSLVLSSLDRQKAPSNDLTVMLEIMRNATTVDNAVRGRTAPSLAGNARDYLTQALRPESPLGNALRTSSTQEEYVNALKQLGVERPQVLAEKIIASTKDLSNDEAKKLAKVLTLSAIMRQTIAEVKGVKIGSDDLPFTNEALSYDKAEAEFNKLFGVDNNSGYTFKAIADANSAKFRSLTTATAASIDPFDAYLKANYADSARHDRAKSTILSGNLDYLAPDELFRLARASGKNVAKLIRPDLYPKLDASQRRMADAARQSTISQRLIAKSGSIETAKADFQKYLGDDYLQDGKVEGILQLLAEGKSHKIKNEELLTKIAEYLSFRNSRGLRAIVELETELSDSAAYLKAYGNLGRGLAKGFSAANNTGKIVDRYRKLGDAASEGELLREKELDALSAERIKKIQMLALAKIKDPTQLFIDNKLPAVTKIDEFGALMGSKNDRDRAKAKHIAGFINSRSRAPQLSLADFVRTTRNTSIYAGGLVNEDSSIKELLGISFNQLDKIDDLDLRHVIKDYERIERIHQRLSVASEYPDVRFPGLHAKLPKFLQGVNYPFKLKAKVDPKQRVQSLANLMLPDRQVIETLPGQTADSVLGKDVKNRLTASGIQLPEGSKPNQIYAALKEGLEISTQDLTKTIETIYVDRARLKDKAIEQDEKNAIHNLLRLQSYASKVAAGKNKNANLARLISSYNQIKSSAKSNDKFYQSFLQAQGEIDKILTDNGNNLAERMPEFFAGNVPIDLDKIKNLGLAIPDLLNQLEGSFYNTDLDKFARSLKEGTVDSYTLGQIEPLLKQLPNDRGQAILDALVAKGMGADNQKEIYNTLGLSDPRFALDPKILAAKQAIAAGDYSKLGDLSAYLQSGLGSNGKLVEKIDQQGAATNFKDARQKAIIAAAQDAQQFAKSNQVYQEIYGNLASQGIDRIESLAADLQGLFGRIMIEPTEQGKPIAIPPALVAEIKTLNDNWKTVDIEDVLQKVLSGQYRDLAEFNDAEQKILQALMERMDISAKQLLRLETAPTGVLGRVLSAPGTFYRQLSKAYGNFQEAQNASIVAISRRMGMSYAEVAQMLEFEGLTPSQIAKFFDDPHKKLNSRKQQVKLARHKLTEQLKSVAGLQTTQINAIFQEVDNSDGTVHDREDLLKSLVNNSLTASGRGLEDVMRTMALLDRGGMKLDEAERNRLAKHMHEVRGMDSKEIAVELERRAKSNQFATAAIGTEKLSDYIGTTAAQTKSIARLFGIQLDTLEQLYNTRSPIANAAVFVLRSFKRALSPAGIVKITANLAAVMGMRLSARRLERTAASMQERQDLPKLPLGERLAKGLEENLVRPLLGSLARTYQQPTMAILSGIAKVTGKLGDTINIYAAGRVWGMTALSQGLHKLEADLNRDVDSIRNDIDNLPGIKKNLKTAYQGSFVKKIIDFAKNLKLSQQQGNSEIDNSTAPVALESVPLALRVARGIVRNPVTAALSGASEALGNKLVEIAENIRKETIATLVVDTSVPRGLTPTFKSEIRSVRATAIEKIGKLIIGLSHPLVTAFDLYDRTIDFGADAMTASVAKFRSVKAKLNNYLYDSTDRLDANDNSLADKIKTKVLELAIDSGSIFPRIKSTIGGLYGKIGNYLYDSIDRLDVNDNSLAAKAKAKILDAAIGVYLIIGDSLTKIRDTIASVTSRIWSSLKFVVGQIGTSIRGLFSSKQPENPVQGPARPGRAWGGWRELINEGRRPRPDGEVPLAYRDEAARAAHPTPIPNPWDTPETPTAIPAVTGMTQSHIPVVADPWNDGDSSPLPVPDIEPHVDPNPAIAAVESIDDKMAHVNQQIEENWDYTEDRVTYNIKNIAFAAKKLGYWIMRYLSEGSPGPTYYIRENYADTAEFAVVKMRQMVAAAKLAGAAITANLAGKDASKQTAKFNRLQANIFAHRPGTRVAATPVDGLDVAMAEINAHTQESAHSLDRMAHSARATATAATQTATEINAATANTTRFGAVIERVRGRLEQVRALAARITIGGGVRTTLKGAALLGGGIGGAFMGIQALGDAGSQMGVFNDTAQQAMYKMMGLLQMFTAVTAIGGGAVTAILAIAQAVIGLSQAALGLLLNPIVWYIVGFIEVLLLLNETIKVFTGFDVLGAGLSKIGLDGESVSKAIGAIGEKLRAILAPAIKWVMDNVVTPFRAAMVSIFGEQNVANFEKAFSGLCRDIATGLGFVAKAIGFVAGLMLAEWGAITSVIVKVRNLIIQFRDLLIEFTNIDLATGTIFDSPAPIKKIKLWTRFLTFFRNAWTIIAARSKQFFMQIIGNKLINRVRQMQGCFGSIGSTLGGAATWVRNAWGGAIDWIQAKFTSFVSFIDGIRIAVINLLNHSPTVQIPLAWEGAIDRMQSKLEGFLSPAAAVASQLNQMFANPFGNVGKTFEDVKRSLFGESKPIVTVSATAQPEIMGPIAPTQQEVMGPLAPIVSSSNLSQGFKGWFGGQSKSEVVPEPGESLTNKATALATPAIGMAENLWQNATSWFGGFNKPESQIPDSEATIKAIVASKSIATRATDIAARPGNKLLSDKAIERVPILQATAEDLDAQIAKRRELAKLQLKAQNPSLLDRWTGAVEKSKAAVAAQVEEIEKSLKLSTLTATSQLGNDTTNSIVSKLGIDPDGLMQAGGDISSATIGKITAAADEMGMAFNDAFTYFDDVGHLAGISTIAERALYQVGEGFDTMGKAFGDLGTEAFEAIKKMDLQGLARAGGHFVETMKLGLGQVVNGFKEAAFNAVAFGLWMIGATTPVSFFFVVLGVTLLYLTIRFKEFRQIFPGIINVVIGFAKIAIATIKAIIGTVEGFLMILGGIPDALTGDFTKINLGIIKIQETFSHFLISFEDGWEQIKKGFGQIGAALEAVYYGVVVTTFENLKLIFESWLRAFEGGLDGMGEYWLKVWNYWSGVVSDKFNEMTAGIFIFADRAFEPILNKASEFGTAIGTVFKEVVGRLASLAMELTAEWQPQIDRIVDLVRQAGDRIADIVGVVVDRILAIPTAIASAIDTFANGSIVNLLNGYTESLLGFANNLGTTIVDGFGNARSMLLASIQGTISELTSIFTGAGEAIANTFNGAFEAIEQKWEKTTGFVTNLWGRLRGKSAETGQEILHNLAENSPGPTAQIRERYSETVEHLEYCFKQTELAAANSGGNIEEELSLSMAVAAAKKNLLKMEANILKIEAEVNDGFQLKGAISSTGKMTGVAANLAKTLGGADLAKPFEQLDGAVSTASTTMSAIDTFKDVGGFAGALSGIASGVSWVGGAIATVFPMLGAGLAWLGSAFGAMGTAAAAAWSAVIAPILPIIIVVGLLVGALIWLGSVMYSNNFLGFADFWDGLTHGLGQIVDGVFGTLGGALGEIFGLLGSVATTLLAPFAWLGSAIQGVVDTVSGGGKEMSIVSAIAKGLTEAILLPFRIVGWILQGVILGISALIKAVVFLGAIVVGVVLAPFMLIAGVIGATLNLISLFIGAIKFLGEIALGALVAPFQTVANIFQFIAGIVGQIFAPILNILGGPLGTIVGLVTGSTQAAPPQEVQAFATGGYVTGPGGPTDDRVPAYLSNREFVVNAEATSRNRSFLEAINNGVDAESAIALLDVPHPVSTFAQSAAGGTPTTESSKSSDRPITIQINFGDIVLNSGSREDAEKVKEYLLVSLQSPEARETIARALRDEIEMMR